MLGPPERERRRPDETAPRIPVTATSNEESIPNSADSRRIGELLGAWLDVRMAEVDDLVAEARSKVEAIPNLRSLWLVIGELVVRLSAVELEVAELRKAAKR